MKTPIVIDNILVSGPEVFYEMKGDGAANVDIMKENLLVTESSSREAKPQESPKGKEVKLLVRRVVFEKGMPPRALRS
jgi:hypothetical protein